MRWRHGGTRMSVRSVMGTSPSRGKAAAENGGASGDGGGGGSSADGGGSSGRVARRSWFVPWRRATPPCAVTQSGLRETKRNAWSARAAIALLPRCSRDCGWSDEARPITHSSPPRRGRSERAQRQTAEERSTSSHWREWERGMARMERSGGVERRVMDETGAAKTAAA